MPSASYWMSRPKVNKSTNRAYAFHPHLRLPPVHTTSRAPDPQKQLAENTRRIFAERGHDFFEKRDAAGGRIEAGDTTGLDDEHEESSAEATTSTQPMTPEQLFKMRSDIVPRLEWVLNI